MFYLNQSFQYDITVHDTDYFVLNTNPLGLPSISRGGNFPAVSFVFVH